MAGETCSTLNLPADSPVDRIIAFGRDMSWSEVADCYAANGLPRPIIQSIPEPQEATEFFAQKKATSDAEGILPPYEKPVCFWHQVSFWRPHAPSRLGDATYWIFPVYPKDPEDEQKTRQYVERTASTACRMFLMEQLLMQKMQSDQIKCGGLVYNMENMRLGSTTVEKIKL
jgi:hypothetical protein